MENNNYLITTDAWFFAPDGLQYRAVWGNVQIIEDSFLGIKTNRNSSNWFAKVGTDENHVIIAGCQIHYAVKSDTAPNTNKVEDYAVDASNLNTYIRPTSIYLAI